MPKKDLAEQCQKVEMRGIEPRTCRMRSDHSTPELHPPTLNIEEKYVFMACISYRITVIIMIVLKYYPQPLRSKKLSMRLT